MHEYSVVRALIDRVEQEARARGAQAVHHLTVRLGEVSGVEPGLFASAYELAREGTLCAGAELAIERAPAAWECRACGRPIAAGAVLRCASCGKPARLRGGDEIVLERIELEVA
jgi:hydrogenase nickel incorporation protein HypA/HybF